MKYIYEIAARVNENESTEIKHNKFIDALKKNETEWGIPQDTLCPTPTFGNHWIAFFPLRKIIRGNITGDIMYRYRGRLDNDHRSDDSIFIEFDTKKIDDIVLINESLLAYVNAFEAYSASIYPAGLLSLKKQIPFEVRSKLNYRNSLPFFSPYQFMDNTLIQNIFGFSPEYLADKLKNKIYAVETFEKGIYFKANNKFVTEEEAVAFNQRMQNLTGVSLPIVGGYNQIT